MAGHRISANGVRDVADAAERAGVRVPDGRLLSVLGDRVLDEHANPAVILIDGVRAALTSPVHSGDVIRFVPGPDRVESTRAVSMPQYLDPDAAALYVTYQPGVRNVVEGAVSGEQVSSTLIAAPIVGRLRAAARFAFTFDDGPNPPYTGQVLSLLAAHHTPAIFCIIGSSALNYPGLVRQEADAGYRVCDHTQTHPLDLPDLTATQIEWELQTGARSITSADGGISPLYFRAPGGNWSTTITTDARNLHLIPLSWTVDPRDWSRPGTQSIVLTVLDQLRPNGIVLMHDGGGDRSETVAALTTLLSELTASGWDASYPTWIS